MLRLASLLWRLRRATTMAADLFDIQADHLGALTGARQTDQTPREVVYALFRRLVMIMVRLSYASPLLPVPPENKPPLALDRVSRFQGGTRLARDTDGSVPVIRLSGGKKRTPRASRRATGAANPKRYLICVNDDCKLTYMGKTQVYLRKEELEALRKAPDATCPRCP